MAKRVNMNEWRKRMRQQQHINDYYTHKDAAAQAAQTAIDEEKELNDFLEFCNQKWKEEFPKPTYPLRGDVWKLAEEAGFLPPKEVFECSTTGLTAYEIEHPVLGTATFEVLNGMFAITNYIWNAGMANKKLADVFTRANVMSRTSYERYLAGVK